MNRPVILFLLLFLMACGSDERVPEELLPRDKFLSVLIEAQLIEARTNHELVIEQRSDSPVERYYEEMFKEQGVSRAAFDSTYAYYARRPEQMKAIYEEVLTELTRSKEEDR